MIGGPVRLAQAFGAIFADRQQPIRKAGPLSVANPIEMFPSASVTAVVRLSPVSLANSSASRWASFFLMFKLIVRSSILPSLGHNLPQVGHASSRAACGCSATCACAPEANAQ